MPPILQGQTVTITAVAHSVNDYWAHGDVANKKVLGGSSTPIWRIRASLQMPPLAYHISKDPKLLVGFGAGGPEDVPPLVKMLASPQDAVRRDAAAELGLIGRHAIQALAPLQKALQDADATVRIAAAEAILRIDPLQAVLAKVIASHEALLPKLTERLKTPDANTRMVVLSVIILAGRSCCGATYLRQRVRNNSGFHFDRKDVEIAARS